MSILPNVIRLASAEPWAILPEKLEALGAILELRANGESVSADIIAAHAAAKRTPATALGGAVAVIPIFGVIAPRMNVMSEISGGTSAEQLTSQIQAALDNPQITAIVLDVDSPGGQVAGIEAVAQLIFAARGTKPLIAIANHMMASAAYWVASAADEIVAAPGAEVGAIGCYVLHVDQSQADAKAGLTRTLIRAGTAKADEIPYFPLSDDARAALQAKVDEYYAQFVADVAKHRGTTAAAVQAGYGEGRMLAARAALEAQLIDRIATLDDVIAGLLGPASRASARAHTPTPALVAAAVTDARGGAPLPPSVPRIHLTAPKAKEHPVDPKDPAAPDGAEKTREQEIHEISSLAEQHAMQDRLPKWMQSQASVASVKSEIITELKDRLAKGPVTKPRADLSPMELERYSFARALVSALDGTPSFERDVHEEISTNLPQGYKPQGGFFMPTTIDREFKGAVPSHLRPMAAGLDSTAATKGPELKYTQYGGFIDMLRNKARVLAAGARMMSGLTGPVTFTKQNGAGTFTWMAENSLADVAESNLLLGTVSLTAKTGQSTTSFSRQLLRQAVEDIESLVRNDLAAIHALGIDAAALFGTGAGNQPTGVYNTAGVGVVALGTNGLAPTYQALVNQQVQVEQANADDLGAGAYITTPGIKGTLRLLAKLANTIADPIWDDSDRVAGRPGYSTNQVQANLTKGSGTNLHAIYYAIWQQLLIGEWGAMEILTDPFRLKKQGMIEVTSFQMIDIAPRWAGAFSVIKDAISTF